MSDSPRAAKAYHNREFLHSREARAIRVLAEYLEPEARFKRLGVRDTIVFFGSARLCSREQAEAEFAEVRAGGGDRAAAERRVAMSRYYEEARALARRLSEWSQALPGHEGRFVICTGGGPGVMEAASRGAADAGAPSVGLSISMPIAEFQNPYIPPELAFEFHYFFMRKFWFSYLAKAVVVMPGGFGTLDELFEVMTLIQTLKMKKRLPIVLYGNGYWDEVVDFEAMVRHGTIGAADPALFLRADSVEEAFEQVTAGLIEHALDGGGGPTL